MKKIIVLFVLVLINSCTNSNDEFDVQHENARLNENVEYKVSSKGSSDQVVYTLEDFERLSNDENSVVSKLSTEAKDDFIRSMEFRSDDGFITTAKYTIIEKELSQEDNEVFWRLFGMEELAFTDYKDYKCVSAHNCQITRTYICLTGC